MQDHFYIRDNGERVPVSQMTDAEISECLSGGVDIEADDVERPRAETVSDVMERLRIEIVARRLPEGR